MRLVFCSCPVNEAELIAKTLLTEKLVACVNVIPGAQSYYAWKGEICHDEESVLIIKTRKERIPRLIERINDIHSYDTVEIIVLDIVDGDEKYLNWISEVTS